jgi:hypothetical protein
MKKKHKTRQNPYVGPGKREREREREREIENWKK